MNDSERNPNNGNLPGSQETGQRRYDGEPDNLHDLFAGSADDEDDPLAALRNDPNYAALIRDLEYIASQARLLFEPAEQAPSDEVWKKIQDQMQDQLQSGQPPKPEAE